MRADDSGALGWFGVRWQATRDDHYRFHDTAGWTRLPPRPWPTPTGARLKRSCSFSMPRLFHRDAAGHLSMGGTAGTMRRGPRQAQVPIIR